MSVLYIMLPAALAIAAAAIVAFARAARSGQFDDLDTPAYRMLVDDDPAGTPGGMDQAPRRDESAPS